MLKFLSVADLHCANAVGMPRRHEESFSKLEAALPHAAGCDFVIDMGDTADVFKDCMTHAEIASTLEGIFKQAGLPVFRVLGNHDMSSPKADAMRLYGLDSRYYAFYMRDFLCVVLDGNVDDPGEPMTRRGVNWKNAMVDGEQLAWLEETLRVSPLPVLVFCHELFAMSEEEDSPLMLRNAPELRRLFEESGKVRAVFSGHHHDGDFAAVNGIPYFTLAAMCGEGTAFALVTADRGAVSVEGFGRQPSLSFSF